jgi:hypothetical protein
MNVRLHGVSPGLLGGVTWEVASGFMPRQLAGWMIGRVERERAEVLQSLHRVGGGSQGEPVAGDGVTVGVGIGGSEFAEHNDSYRTAREFVVTLRLTLNIIKFLAGCASVLVFFYRNGLFSEFARAGTLKADATHTVLTNNHGSVSFITMKEHNYLYILMIISVTLMVLVVVLDLIQRKFYSPKLDF